MVETKTPADTVTFTLSRAALDRVTTAYAAYEAALDALVEADRAGLDEHRRALASARRQLARAYYDLAPEFSASLVVLAGLNRAADRFDDQAVDDERGVVGDKGTSRARDDASWDPQ